MPTLASSISDDHADPLPSGLSRFHRRLLIVAGGVIGAVIGPTGFLLQIRLNTYRATGRDLVGFPGSPGEWGNRLAGIASLGSGQAFLICSFVATLALVPFLIRWLEGRVGKDPRSYYVSAAIGGVGLGAVATFIVAWALFLLTLIAGSASATPSGGGAMTIAALLGGMFIFGPMIGVIAPFFFMLPIIGAGLPYGLVAGLAVRRLARRDSGR